MGEGGGRKGTARGMAFKDVAWCPVDLCLEVPEALLDRGVVGFLEEVEECGGSNKPLERVDIVRLEGEAAGGDSIEVLECELRVDLLGVETAGADCMDFCRLDIERSSIVEDRFSAMVLCQ